MPFRSKLFARLETTRKLRCALPPYGFSKVPPTQVFVPVNDFLSFIYPSNSSEHRFLASHIRDNFNRPCAVLHDCYLAPSLGMPTLRPFLLFYRNNCQLEHATTALAGLSSGSSDFSRSVLLVVWSLLHPRSLLVKMSAVGAQIEAPQGTIARFLGVRCQPMCCTSRETTI